MLILGRCSSKAEVICMKITRKFNLNRYLRIPYESVEITVVGKDLETVARDIDVAFSAYVKMVSSGQIK
ncbi:hypothetical protein MUP59_03930 [Candidatus Bathyarchaeota archaeon]|nr:hypothetical protein [Candidatus Bathyarchaeota archaeon]